MPRRFLSIDPYVVHVLMRDLIGHDRAPSAFLVYLYLSTQARPARKRHTVRVSLRTVADDTGLSKSAVQAGLKILKRRRLITSRMSHRTATPVHMVHRTWARPL